QSQGGLIAGTWNVDPIHSQIMVSVRHFSVANLRAKFPQVTGGLQVDAENPLRSSFQVEIDARAVAAGPPAKETFMRWEPWLDAENPPPITFRSSAIEPTHGGFLIKGDLTLKGVTREIEIPADFHGVVSDPWGLRAGFTSQFTID